MKNKLTVRLLLLLGLWLAAAAAGRAEVYFCLTWELNSRTIVDIDDQNRARCSGMGQVRVATIEAEPYQGVDLDQNTGFVTTTYLTPYSDWQTYLQMNYDYENRYSGGFITLYYLSNSLWCNWACPTPYDDLDYVVPYFSWETQGGLPTRSSGSFSGNFYFY
jgi:hypothetical protein